jgi:hypothetical protein
MTMKESLLKLLKRQWLSPVDALRLAGCMSLSQRCGEFRRDGVNVVDRWVEQGGKRFKTYRIYK